MEKPAFNDQQAVTYQPGPAPPYNNPGQPPYNNPGQPPYNNPGQAQYNNPGHTTVIVQQNQQFVPTTRTWSSGMCSCFDDMESCCCVFWFGGFYSCCLYSKYGECCCTPMVVPIAPMILRTQHRNRNKIVGTILDDCCMTLWCGPCSLCQLKRDMDYVVETKGSLEF